MILPDYEKLFEPYSESCTIEMMIDWLRKTSRANEEIISLCVRNLFTELAHGKTFLHKCDCGCEIDAPHVAINHYLLKNTLELKAEADREYSKVLERVDQARIIKHIELENAAYTKDKTATLRYKLAHSRPVRWFKKPQQDTDYTPMGM